MSTPYEVTYLNMWPSETLNARVRDRAGELQRLAPDAEPCHVWFERSAADGSLNLKVEATFDGRAHCAQRSIAAKRDNSAVCAAIDSAFLALRAA